MKALDTISSNLGPGTQELASAGAGLGASRGFESARASDAAREKNARSMLIGLSKA